MASQVSKNIQALAEAAEERRRLKEQGLDPSVAGLGLGGGFVASQVGGKASTSSKLSPFAQKIADADTARLNTKTASTPVGRQPSLATAQSAARQSAREAAARQAARSTASRGPSATAQLGGKFLDNVLGDVSKFARLMPSLMMTPNTMGDATLTGNNMALGQIDQMATDQYQEMLRPTIRQESLMNPPSAAEAGENLINIGNSLFPQEQPANLMTPELRDQRAAERQRKYGDIELNPDPVARFAQDLINTPKELGRRFNEFAGTLMRAATPEEELGYTPPSIGDVLATVGIRDAEGNVIGSGGRSEPITGPTRLPQAPSTTASTAITPTDGMDIAQRGPSGLEQVQGQAPQIEATFTLPSGEVRSIMAGQDVASAFGREYGRPTALQANGGEMNAQQADLSPAQKNFLARKEKGTPLTPDEINAAQRYAVSQGQIFDPETGYSQAEFYGQRYKGQSIGDYLRGEDRSNLAPDYSSYSTESAAREARLANKLDFNEPFVYRDGKKVAASEARKDVMSKAQALKISGGDRKKADQMIELQKMGRDPITGQLEKPDYQAETLRQNQERIKQEQERIDLAKQQAEDARKAAEAKGATQAQKDAFEMKQKQLNYAITYQNFLKDQEAPAFDAKDIEADLDGIQSQLDIIYDPKASVFRKGKIWGEGEVIKIDDPKNAGIVRTIGTYKVGKALLDKYPKKG